MGHIFLLFLHLLLQPSEAVDDLLTQSLLLLLLFMGASSSGTDFFFGHLLSRQCFLPASLLSGSRDAKSASLSRLQTLSLSQLWLQLKPSRVKESHRRRRRLSVSPVSAAEAMNRRIDGRYCCVLLAEHNARVSTIRPTLTMDNKSIKARWIWCGVAPESRARRRRRLRRQLGCTRPCLKKS